MSCIPTFSCALATKGANTSADVAAMAWRRVTRDFILHLPYCRGRAAAASEAEAKLTTLQQPMGGGEAVGKRAEARSAFMGWSWPGSTRPSRLSGPGRAPFFGV